MCGAIARKQPSICRQQFIFFLQKVKPNNILFSILFNNIFFIKRRITTRVMVEISSRAELTKLNYKS